MVLRYSGPILLYFKTALIVFGNALASFAISLYKISLFQPKARIRASFCFLSIVHKPFVS
jgi:hypothetical protein